MAVDSCSDFGLKDSSVVEEQRDFQLRSAKTELQSAPLFYLLKRVCSAFCFTVQKEITKTELEVLFMWLHKPAV